MTKDSKYFESIRGEVLNNVSNGGTGFSSMKYYDELVSALRDSEKEKIEMQEEINRLKGALQSVLKIEN